MKIRRRALRDPTFDLKAMLLEGRRDEQSKYQAQQIESKVEPTVGDSGGSSVSQNKLPQLILGYIYILKYLQSNFIG